MEDLYDLGIKYTCDSCFGDISQVVRIKCAVCSEIDLCVSCFGSGSSVKSHQPDHDYYVIEPLTFSIYEDNWSAQEELLLLEGLEKKGFGNWNDTSKHVGSKSAQECESHYYKMYLNSSIYPLPNPEISIPREAKKHAICHNLSSENGELYLSVCTSQSSLFSPQALSSVPAPTSQPSNHEIVGFMPKRNDFECETENDFEHLIKDLQFNESEDSKSEIELKLLLLQNYYAVLERREEKKRFAFDRNLVEFKQLQSLEKARSKDQKSLLFVTRRFAQFLSPNDYETFMQGLLLEDKLKDKITALQKSRKAVNQPSTIISAIPRQISTLLENSSPINLADQFSIASTTSSPGNSELNNLKHTSPIEKPESTPPSFGTDFSLTQYQADDSAAKKRRVGIPIDLTDVEGVELLSHSEIELCSILRLLPRVYLNIKETLLKEQAKIGYLKRAVARGLVKIDVNKTGRIYDFFVAAGWIRPSKNAKI